MMNLSKKLSEFSKCYHKLSTISLKRIGLTSDFNRIKDDSLLSIFYFTVFVHERQGTNPDFQKFHRIAIRNTLNGKEFLLELKNNDFPNRVWENFKHLTGDKPNEKITKGPVCDILKKMQDEDEPNIIKLLSKKKDIVDAHNFLLSIKGLGDKISAFILRDFQCFLKLWGYIPDEEKYRLQPVDRWVRRFSGLCWKNNNWESDKHNDNAKLIVECCHNDGIDPIAFNQGAWFVGSHYTDLWRFHKISENDSIKIENCIMKFNISKIVKAIKKYEKLMKRSKIFNV